MSEELRRSDFPVDENPQELELARALGKYVDQLAEAKGRESPPPPPEIEEEAEIFRLIHPLLDEPDEKAERGRVLFGDYRIVRLLGQSRMSTVYEAHQISVDRRVALKVLSASLSDNPTAMARFRREARTLAKLSHPSLVQVYTAGVDQDSAFIAMEFVVGEDLERHLQRRLAPDFTENLDSSELADAMTQIFGTAGSRVPKSPAVGSLGNAEGTDGAAPIESDWGENDGAEAASPRAQRRLDPAWCLRIAEAFAEVAEGLHFAHRQGVFHRDLKLSNLILDAMGRLRILDFGLVHVEGDPEITQAGEFLGTLYYVSPEQLRDARRADARSDVYSLGATLYQLLSGRPPLMGKSDTELKERIVRSDPVLLSKRNPSVPNKLETIVHQCLKKDPSDRYATAEALAQDLRRFVQGEDIEAGPEPLPISLAKALWRHRRRAVELAAAAVLVFAVLLFAWGRWEKSRELDDEAYDSGVKGAVLKMVRRPLLSAAVRSRATLGEGRPFSVLQDDSSDVSRRTSGEGGHARIIVSGYDTVESGPALVETGPDPLVEGMADLERCIERLPGPPAAHYHLARGWVARGDRRKALEILDRISRIDPAFEPALGLRAVLLEGEKKSPPPSVVPGTSRSAAESEGWVDDWSRAHRAVLDRDWKAAADAYSRIFKGYLSRGKQYPGALVEVRLEKGRACLLSGDLLGALDDFAVSGEAFPDELEPRLLKGKVLHLHGDRERAELVFREIHEGGNGDGAETTAHVIAQAYFDLGDFVASRTWLAKAGDRCVRWCMESEVERRLGKAGASVTAARRAVASGSSDPSAQMALGNSLLLQGDVKEARILFEEVKRRPKSTAGPQVALGVCLDVEGRLDEAAETLRDATRREPTLAVAQYNLGRVLARLSDRDGAREAYRRALELDPVHALSLNNLGVLCYLDGDLDGAVEYYSKAVEAEPRLRIAQFNLGWALQRQRRFFDAAAAYRRALTLGLEIPELRNNLAACLTHMMKLEEARKEYERAILLSPNDPLAHHGLGVVHEYRRDDKAALESFGRASEFFPDWSAARNDYGNLLRHHERNAEAEPELRRAIEIDPRNVGAENDLADLLLRSPELLPSDERRIKEDLVRFEDARQLPAARTSIDSLVSDLRRRLGSRPASFAAIDEIAVGPASLLGEDSPAFEGGWRSLWVRTQSEAPTGWRDRSFEEIGWHGVDRSGASLAPAADGAVLLLRRRFTVNRPEEVAGLVLATRIADGFLAYLNGSLAASLRGKESQSESTNVERHPWIVRRSAIDPGLLRQGENLLTIVALGSSGGAPKLHAIPDFCGEFRSAAVRLSELRSTRDKQIGDPAMPEKEPGLAPYFKGRILQAEKRFQDAMDQYQEAASLRPERSEPVLRIAECHAGMDHPSEAEKFLRDALRTSQGSNVRLWEAWFELAVNRLGWKPAEVLAAMPDAGGEALSRGVNRAADLRWVLRELAAGGPLRIDCGGVDHRSGGIRWGRDRFYLGGIDRYQTGVVEARAGKPSDPVDENARSFDDEDYWNPERKVVPAYRIPLPSGTYRLSLRFVGHSGGRERPEFGVLVEGVRTADVNLGAVAVGKPIVERRDVTVRDGALDVAFELLKGDPRICGIEIEMLPDGR